MIKCTTHSESWIILDSMRGIVTPSSPSGTAEDARLLANTSGAEYSASSTSYIKLHANGFELTGTGGEINAASRDYIYVAIARPHKPASELTATDLLEITTYTGNGSTNRTIGSSITPDMVLLANRDGTSYSYTGYAHYLYDRIRGEDQSLATSTNTATVDGWSNSFFNF